jgi:ankyrin repeat protein
MHMAAIAGYFNTAVMLLKFGASADGEDEDGRTPASIAAEKGYAGLKMVLDNWA